MNRKFLVAGLVMATCGVGYTQDATQPLSPAATESVSFRDGKIIVPNGTQVPIRLKQAISTKNAKLRDAVYAETNFPITMNDRLVIPAGTYVQGRITQVKRPGRIKGRAEVLMHFTSLVFPSGYTAVLPGAVENIPGAENQHMASEEGTIQQNGSKAKDAATIGQTATSGGFIGAIAGGRKGALLGAAGGGAVGLAIAMLTRGDDIILPEGTGLQMVLQRELVLDESRVKAR